MLEGTEVGRGGRFGELVPEVVRNEIEEVKEARPQGGEMLFSRQ